MKKTLLAASLIAFSMGATAVEKDQFYVGVTLGSSSVDTDITDDRAATYGIIGGYQFDDKMSLELSYQKSDDIKDVQESSGVVETYRAEVSRTSFGLRYDVIQKSGIEVSALFGMQRWTTDEETNNTISGGLTDNEDSGTDLYYGIGVKHELSDDFYVGFDYKITNHSHPDYEEDIRFDEWSATLTRSF